MKPRHAWLAYIAAGALVDAWRTHRCDGSTLSQATRDTFHTNTRVGRFAFLSAWAALAAWFPHHILRNPLEEGLRRGRR